MLNDVSLSRPGRFTRPAIVAVIMTLLLALTVVMASAQSVEDGVDFPTEADLAAMPEPTVLSETRRGDVTTLTISIPVGADTFTTSSRPTTNWDTSHELRVGFNLAQGNGAQRIFLFFGLGSIPSNATIQTAILEAWVSGFSPIGDQPMGLEARFLNSAWDPTTLTWASYNPAWGASIGVGQNPPIAQKISANITGPVAEWVAGTRANHGLMIQGDETPQQRERIFHSWEAPNDLHPRLIVTYDIDTMPPTSTMTALPQWSPATFDVVWSGQDNQGGSGVRHFDVQFRSNGGAWQNWQTATTATTAAFTGQHGILYEFRVRAVDRANNVQAFPTNPQASTTVDAVAPTSTVTPLPQFTFADSFMVTWTGSDPLSGLAFYDVEYQVNGGAWQTFLSQTTLANSQFTGATPGTTYGFRVRAADRAGNVQPFPGAAQAQTTISTGEPQAWIVPFPAGVVSTNSFLVQWAGQSAPGTSLVYEVQFRFNNGPWQPWLINQTITSQTFNAQAGDGVYAFQVRARDSAGRVTAFTSGPASAVAVDQVAPFITRRPHFPIVVK